ncbi:phosphoenolpyruvate synthase, partial [bacterium]
GGFILSTRAYRSFCVANGLDDRIQAALPANPDDPEALAAAATAIAALFASASLPAELEDAVRQAYFALGSPPVAVRSSATAEDLPEMSFAGQQDTYLNVVGADALLRAVRDCWASLWTARAIAYRARNRVPHEGMALAVVVQRMVDAAVSGVLFTANPLSGLRSQTVIDATYGLGEALVSGQVEPDHYEVDTRHARITARVLGRKALAIRPQAGGGTLRETPRDADRQALSDDQILALAALGQRVAALYDEPQDIEWAWADGQLYLLQSRAVTSLYPIPEGVPAEPLQVFTSFGTVQGMLEPMTPLGRDAIRHVFAMGAGLVGIRVTAETQAILFESGERLWGRITTLMRNSVGRKAVPVVLELVEPGTRDAILTVLKEPGLQPGREGVSWHARRQMARLLLPVAANFLLNWLSPRARREKIVARGEQVLAVTAERCAALHGTPHERLGQWTHILPDVMSAYLPRAFILFVSAVASAMGAYNLLRLRVKALPPREGVNWTDTLLEVTRGIPHNPTTEMDLALWNAACAIRRDPDAAAEFEAHSPTELAGRYRSAEMTPALRQVLEGFLQRYGGRGFCEIDLGRPRWSEDPTHVLEVLSGYLQIQPGENAPDVVFARGAASGEAALDRLVDGLRRTHGGWFKARQARFLGRRVRALMGAREAPKFFVVRLFAQVRWSLLEIGEALVQAGELDRADDLFYLRFKELAAFAAGTTGQPGGDWRKLVAGRREAFRRETLRRQLPRLLLSDGRAFYD